MSKETSILPENEDRARDLPVAGPCPFSVWRQAESLSEMIHRAGHDIGNPLTAIISLASILDFSSAPQSGSNSPIGLGREKLNDYALSIGAESWKVSHLVERLVMMYSSRIGNPHSYSVGEMAERVLQRLRSRQKIEDFEIESDFFLAPTASKVQADGDQLFLLLSEIFLNAYHFQPQPEGEDEPKVIHCALTQDDNMVVLRFENPLAYPYEEEPIELLHPLRCGTPKLPAVEGSNLPNRPSKVIRTGIGLSAVWAIATRNGGSVAVGQKQAGDGWRFVIEVSLPIAEDEER